MYTHFIIMGSSYSKGYRIAMDYIVQDVSIDFIQSQLGKIRNEVGNLSCISTRTIMTDSNDWQSVVKIDGFFEGVHIYNDIDEFIEELKSNIDLSSVDIAKYILSKFECTHLKLQKLVYFCHAEYLCTFGTPLFKDKVCAFDNGPICYDAYQAFKRCPQYCFIEKLEDEIVIRSRILSAKDGINKLKSIDTTLEKYGKFTPDELRDITHQDMTPWHMCYEQGQKYTPISNEKILDFHKYEL
ncbi:MAG: Panacea domain-containing protein [Oscillospiraceae bacterium]